MRCWESMPTARGNMDRHGATRALSLLLTLAILQLRNGSSFLIPTTKAVARGCSAHGSRSASCLWASAERAAQSNEVSADVSDVIERAEEEKDGGCTKSPAGLTLEGVYKRLKVEVQDLDEGVVGLESKDPDYGIEIVKTRVRREPSLGLRLEEVARGNDGRGLVLVAGVEPGGNADASGKIAVGDTLAWAGVEGSMSRLEAFDWDQTVSILSSFADESEIVLVVKRLVKRESINVQFELPDGNREYDIKAGSNLRGEMIRLDVPVYDPKTLRYDQPYATGNCAGEGICGTCFVEVQEGAGLLTPPDREELMLLSKGNLPGRWRLSCKLIVGMENKAGQVKVKAVPQAEWRAQRKK